jgi:hypothetical protein
MLSNAALRIPLLRSVVLRSRTAEQLARDIREGVMPQRDVRRRSLLAAENPDRPMLRARDGVLDGRWFLEVVSSAHGRGLNADEEAEVVRAILAIGHPEWIPETMFFRVVRRRAHVAVEIAASGSADALLRLDEVYYGLTTTQQHDVVVRLAGRTGEGVAALLEAAAQFADARLLGELSVRAGSVPGLAVALSGNDSAGGLERARHIVEETACPHSLRAAASQLVRTIGDGAGPGSLPLPDLAALVRASIRVARNLDVSLAEGSPEEAREEALALRREVVARVGEILAHGEMRSGDAGPLVRALGEIDHTWDARTWEPRYFEMALAANPRIGAEVLRFLFEIAPRRWALATLAMNPAVEEWTLRTVHRMAMERLTQFRRERAYRRDAEATLVSLLARPDLPGDLRAQVMEMEGEEDVDLHLDATLFQCPALPQSERLARGWAAMADPRRPEDARRVLAHALEGLAPLPFTCEILDHPGAVLHVEVSHLGLLLRRWALARGVDASELPSARAWYHGVGEDDAGSDFHEAHWRLEALLDAAERRSLAREDHGSLERSRDERDRWEPLVELLRSREAEVWSAAGEARVAETVERAGLLAERISGAEPSETLWRAQREAIGVLDHLVRLGNASAALRGAVLAAIRGDVVRQLRTAIERSPRPPEVAAILTPAPRETRIRWAGRIGGRTRGESSSAA